MMQNFIATRILRAVGGKLDGYKTIIGGIGMILIGVLGIVRIMFPDQTALPDIDVETALTTIAAGFAALGIGGKLQKQTDAIKATAPVMAEFACTSGGVPEPSTLQTNLDKITEGSKQ